MKTVILCGGLGTRLGSETEFRPKPMVSVGPHPILWHILKGYSLYQHNDFVLALGYRALDIKNYFLNYYLTSSDLTIDLRAGSAEPLSPPAEPWRITMVDTGENTPTAGRLLRLKDQLKDEALFMVTYGDGVADVDIDALLAFHHSHGKIATMTVVRPPGQFGNVTFQNGQVQEFIEKPHADDRWINGGFFVFSSKIFDFLGDGSMMLEKAPLEQLVRDGQLMAFQHEGFWQCMDTPKDKQLLNEIYATGDAPWLKKQLQKQLNRREGLLHVPKRFRK